MAISKNALKVKIDRPNNDTVEQGLNALLGGNAIKQLQQSSQIVELEIDKLEHHPEQHHWSMNQDELEWLANNISIMGVLEPIQVVQSATPGKYRILAGHRRTAACNLAGLKTVPARILIIDDNTANKIFLATNLGQRQELLPSEKAYAYSELERLTFKDDGALNNRTTAAIAELTGDNVRKIQRYKRLLKLIPELMEMTDNKQLSVQAGYWLAGCPAEYQELFVPLLKETVCSAEQAQEIATACASENEIDMQEIKAILHLAAGKPTQKAAQTTYGVKLPTEKFSGFFDGKSKVEIEEIIFRALQFFYESKTR